MAKTVAICVRATRGCASPHTTCYASGRNLGFCSAYLNTECALSPKLLHREYTIKYKVKGSLLIPVNGEKILETGAFAKSRSLVSQMQSGFVNFTVHDTLLTMQVTYRQHTQAAGKRLSIAIGNADWGEQSKTEQQQEKYMTYATGGFYFAFAIVFLLLFVFNRTQFENLYFALFCLFVSVYILIDLLYDSFLLDHISKYSIVIAIEFLSLFFATILHSWRAYPDIPVTDW